MGMKELYDNQYPGMTDADANRIKALNRKCSYCLSHNDLVRMAKKHKKARENGDLRTMSMIEYRLTDINFHYECSLMKSGEYDKIAELEE